MIDKAHILSEIKRTAVANGGQALGSRKFEDETGVKENDWRGRHWVKWSDAITEAGLTPNIFTQSYDDDYRFARLADLVAELDRMPKWAELRMKANADKGFPSDKTWGAIGLLPVALAKYCSSRPELAHVLAICERAIPLQRLAEEASSSALTNVSLNFGYCYLLKHGKEYKIGASSNVEERFGRIATQMPQTITNVHTIKTDDPFGVEKYWHLRFEAKRLKGEWFSLSAEDVRAFKRWKNIF
jgi:hypothetical protein